MNSQTHWNWLKDLETLQQSLDGLLSCSPTNRNERPQHLAASDAWSPLMHITQVGEDYLIKAELSGVKDSDLVVRSEAGRLIITGQRDFQTKEEPGKPHGVEPVSETFSRIFSLPDDLKPRNVRVDFKDSLLTVHLRKPEEAVT